MMKGAKVTRLVLAVPLVLILLTPALGRAAVPHLVEYVSIDNPGFTFHYAGGLGYATLGGPSGLTDPVTIDCIQLTSYDLQHQLVQARGHTASYTFYFTFYGNGLYTGRWTGFPEAGQPCGATDYFYGGDQGVGVIA